jgi:ATP-dependent DNA ligase
VYEVKFDGYRVQLHKRDGHVTIYSRNGADFTRRYPVIEQALHSLPAKSFIIDGELVACDAQGRPDFAALHKGTASVDQLIVYGFDLLEHNGKDVRALPLISRKAKLAKLLASASGDWLQYSDVFTDPEKLLAACEEHLLEGIVSKRKDDPYRSGKSDWIKVKCATWREANKDRGDLFKPSRSARR